MIDMKATDLMIGDLVMSFGQVTEVWMVDASHKDEKETRRLSELMTIYEEPYPIYSTYLIQKQL